MEGIGGAHVTVSKQDTRRQYHIALIHRSNKTYPERKMNG